MVVNDTRVIPGRFVGTRRGTGGRVTGLLLRHDGRSWRVLLGSRGTLRPGEHVELAEDAALELVRPAGGARGEWEAVLTGKAETGAVLASVGLPPLPPYILAERKRRGLAVDRPDDAARYATVFAGAEPTGEPASAAAPTAGLHLTPGLLDALEAQGVERAAVTLDIGRGTFEPVRTGRVDDHPIHAERMHVPSATLAALHGCRARGGRVLTVGTTVVRTLESLPHPLPLAEGGGVQHGDGAVHHAGTGGGRPLRLAADGPVADEFPPAAVDAAGDGRGPAGRRAGPALGLVPGGGRSGISFFTRSGMRC